MNATTALERTLRHQRLLVIAGLLGASLLAWAYLLHMLADMPDMSVSLQQLSALSLHPWSGAYFLMIFLMWLVMMAAMMLPTAAPTILIYARVVGQKQAHEHAVIRGYLFAAGYLMTWTLFSLVATALQWLLETAATSSDVVTGYGTLVGGLLLVSAGLYQWTPLKRSCLAHCRSPLEFVSRHWRQGPTGALRMGMEHGLYCVGCCWMLMALLFVGGVMSLLWIAVIMIFVLVEKLAPQGVRAAQLGGVALLLMGGWLVAGALRTLH